jgi:hypothetical protein
MPDNDLADLARRYLAGSLSRTDADAFEDRLGTDQSARDALCAAVGPVAPNPSYRRAVRRRLRPPLWRRMLAPDRYRGHPLLWCAAGAALAFLVAVLLRTPQPVAEPAPQVAAAPQAMPIAPQPSAPPAEAVTTVPSTGDAEAVAAGQWAGRHLSERWARMIVEDRRLARRDGSAPLSVPMEKP